MKRHLKGYLLALAAATAYAAQGLLLNIINRRYAFSPETMIFYRTGLAFLVLFFALAAFRRDLLRFERRDLPLFLLLGSVGMAGFYLVIANAMIVAGVSVTEVLLFTGPVWVTLYAWRFMGEGLGWHKVLALLGMLIGAALVAQVTDLGHLRLNGLGIALGLATGLFSAFYSIISKYAVQRYSVCTVMTIGLAIAWPVVSLFQSPAALWQALTTPGAFPWLLALALGPSLGASLLFVASLAYLPASIVGIVSAWEPVVACLGAHLILGERLGASQLLGSTAIIGSVMLLASWDLRPQRAANTAQT